MEQIPEKLLFAAAAVAAAGVLLICFFVFRSGLPAILDFGAGNFLTSSVWKPTSGSYGILALAAGTLSVTGVALLAGIPTGVACAVLLSQVLPRRPAGAFRFAVELLAGVPSVVYGFFGLSVLVPFIRLRVLPFWQRIDPDARTTGFSILAGGLVLAVMILPTIISLSENALAAVPYEYKEASLALGAGRRATILRVLIPAAKSGILASIILGMGRAIGETMAVLLITGNTARMPHSVLDPVATLTGTIAMEMGYAGRAHEQALFAVGIALFVLILILNLAARAVTKRMRGAA